MAKEKFKESKNSRLFALVVTKELKDEYGKIQQITEWQECINPLNSGSMAKPNKKILSIKWDIPHGTDKGDENDFGDILGKFFK